MCRIIINIISYLWALIVISALIIVVSVYIVLSESIRIIENKYGNRKDRI